MVHNPPKQSQTQRLGNVRNFVRVVKRYLAKYQWTQKDLAVAADMSQSMVSRMFRDQNGRGDTFDLTPEMVMKIACALEAGTEGYMQLMEAAYPEFIEALHNKERTMILKIQLIDKGKTFIEFSFLKQICSKSSENKRKQSVIVRFTDCFLAGA